MEIVELDCREYCAVFSRPYHVYNSVVFNQLNASKADELFFLSFQDKKARLGLIAGRVDNQLQSPFSAPFGGFQYVYEDVKLPHIEQSIGLLSQWAADKNIESVKITLPPCVYHENFIVKQYNCLSRAGYNLLFTDMNYQFDLQKFNGQYLDSIWGNARKNYKRSLTYQLAFAPLPKKSIQTAYDVIAENRAQKGFPLRMSFEQVYQTSAVVPMDAFTVNLSGKPIAAAIVSRVSDQVAQVIYWGDLPDYSDYKPMNFLSYHLFEFYRGQSLRVVDIGPSSENGVPNYGLGEFKESIGCSLSHKFTFLKTFAQPS